MNSWFLDKKEERMFYLSAVLLGLVLGAMCIGIFISLRIFNFPDITTDGSYTLGAAICAVGLVNNWPFLLVFLLSILFGAMAGTLTGLLHTKLKLNNLLSGILVMTALYSVNLAVMGKSNIPIPNASSNIFDLLGPYQTNLFGRTGFILAAIISLTLLVLFMLKTDFGLAMRATGNNASMAAANGIAVDTYKIIGLAIANALVAMSGFLIVQVQGFADINMGIGIVIIGLGAVMMGESLSHLLKIRSLVGRLTGVVLGSIVFRLILSFALSAGVDPIWLKLLTAAMVVLLVGLPNLLPGVAKRGITE